MKLVSRSSQMSTHWISNLGRLAIKIMALVVVLGFLGDRARAQEQTPKFELFGGWSYIYPNSRLHAINPVVNANQESNPRGIGVAATYNFNRWLGLTADFSGTLWGSGETPAQLSILDDFNFYNVSFGPKITLRRKHFAPFAEGLFGWHRLTQDHISLIGSSDHWGFMLGGGVDVPLAKHFGLRLIRADYVFSNHQYAPEALVSSTHVRGVRLQTGVNFMFGGGAKPTPPSASCSAQPTEVFPGEPVRVTAMPSNFNPKHDVAYSWNTTGGKASGTEATTSVDTTGLSAGSYTVTARVSDAKDSKESASCQANFAVTEQPTHAPQISCSANPATVTAGSPSTITCSCSSPDNRKVSIANWVASAGKVSGTEGSATLDTAGMQAGPVSVNATCTDDRGLTATGNANVNVEVPAAAPESSKLNEIDFKKNSAHVDNKAKAALDDVALRLKSDPEAKAVIVGEYAPGEKVGKKLAAQRAVNDKSYLTQGEAGQGIDPTRIDVRTGNGGEMKDENWIVPAGATFKNEGTEAVDERKVKPDQSFGTSHGAAPKAKKSANASSGVARGCVSNWQSVPKGVPTRV